MRRRVTSFGLRLTVQDIAPSSGSGDNLNYQRTILAERYERPKLITLRQNLRAAPLARSRGPPCRHPPTVHSLQTNRFANWDAHFGAVARGPLKRILRLAQGRGRRSG